MGKGRIAGITVEIDGSTTGLDKAIKGTQSNISSVQRSLKDVNRLLKIDPSNTELLSQKQKLLSQAIQETKEKLEIEKEALRQAAEQDIPPDKMDALKREVIATTQELKSLEKQARNSSSVLGAQMQEAGKKISEAGDKIKNVGEGLTKSVTAPLAAVGVAGIKTAADFESAMSDVAATMGTTTENIQDLSDKAREMGEKTEFSATEAAQGLNILAMSGLDAKEQISTIEPVLNLASAGSLSLESAASYATGAIKGFGDSCENAQYYTDLMAKGATLANTDVNGLGEALSDSAATAKSYGQTADGTTLSLLRLAEQNVTGSEAATALNGAMADLFTPTDEAKKALDELGVSAYNLDGSARDVNDVIDDLNGAMSGMSDEQANAYKNTIFTTQGLSAFNKMTATSKDKVNEFRDGLSSASDGMGSAAEQAETKLDNLKGQLTILKSAVSEAAISIGETLTPMIKEIVSKIQEWTDKFNSLSQGQQEMIIKAAAIVAALGPVLVIIGTVVTSIGTVVGAIGKLKTFLGGLSGAAEAAGGGLTLFSSPMLPIIAAIAGVVAAGVLLYQNWDTIKEKASEVAQKAQEKWEGLKTSTLEGWENLRAGAQEKWEGVKTSVTEKVASAKDTAVQGWNTLASNTSQVWSSIQASVQANGGGIRGIIATAVQGYQNIWSIGFNAIDSVTGGKLSSALSTAQEKLSSIKQAFTDKMDGAKNTVHDAIENIKSKFNFSWKLPDLKLPHISIKGSFSLTPPSVPEFGISWYKKAMDSAYLLDGASIFGSMNGNLLAGGESGKEMIMGQEYLLGMIQEANAKSNAEMMRTIGYMGNQMIEMMNRYFPEFAKQKIAIPMREMNRQLRSEGVVYK